MRTLNDASSLAMGLACGLDPRFREDLDGLHGSAEKGHVGTAEDHRARALGTKVRNTRLHDAEKSVEEHLQVLADIEHASMVKGSAPLATRGGRGTAVPQALQRTEEDPSGVVHKHINATRFNYGCLDHLLQICGRHFELQPFPAGRHDLRVVFLRFIRVARARDDVVPCLEGTASKKEWSSSFISRQLRGLCFLLP